MRWAQILARVASKIAACIALQKLLLRHGWCIILCLFPSFHAHAYRLVFISCLQVICYMKFFTKMTITHLSQQPSSALCLRIPSKPHCFASHLQQEPAYSVRVQSFYINLFFWWVVCATPQTCIQTYQGQILIRGIKSLILMTEIKLKYDTIKHVCVIIQAGRIRLWP